MGRWGRGKEDYPAGRSRCQPQARSWDSSARPTVRPQHVHVASGLGAPWLPWETLGARGRWRGVASGLL